MPFEFATATRIVFGAGAFKEAGVIARALGRRALVVTGRSSRHAEQFIAAAREQGMPAFPFAVQGEPDTNAVTQGIAAARRQECDVVVGLGGGSAIDAAKAIAAMLTNEGDLLDYLEVIGRGRTLVRPPTPFLAIPTTAGTGAEATRNAVLASHEHRVKVSLRSPLMLAKVAVVDPELSYDVPPALTASTGLDALTQVIEPYVCARANPMTDALCIEGMQRAARALPRAFRNGHDAAAREDMSVASLFSGMALANAGLGAVHGFAAPIGGMFPAPHGAVCAALLPHVMEKNIEALRAREPAAPALWRYDKVARLLTGNPQATGHDGVTWVRLLTDDLKIPRLGTYGITREHIPELVEKSSRASSMKANPIALTPEELGRILEAAL